MALVLAPFALAVLVACIVTHQFTWLYLLPTVFGFLFGAIVTRSLREGRHEDNTGVFERNEDPLGYWFGVAWSGAAYLLFIGVVIMIAYQIELTGEIPTLKRERKTTNSASEVG